MVLTGLKIRLRIAERIYNDQGTNVLRVATAALRVKKSQLARNAKHLFLGHNYLTRKKAEETQQKR